GGDSGIESFEHLSETSNTGQTQAGEKLTMRAVQNDWATMAGTLTFIAQVSAGSVCAPNFLPAMNITLRILGSAATAARSRRSQAIVSTPQVSSLWRKPTSLKRATPMTRLSGAALRARRASVGPI